MTQPANAPLPVKMRPRQVCEHFGIGRTKLHHLVTTEPGFPRPRRLSSRCTLFDTAELIAWFKQPDETAEQ